MNRTEIVSGLKDLIEGQTRISISDEDQQLDIDSFTMMLIISYLKEEAKVQLDMDELDFDAFASLTTLADMAENKNGSST